MKNEGNYESAPKGIAEAIESSVIVEDFLPPPELLIPKEETKKVTLSLSTRSLEFFKKASKKNHVSYQQMIRKVLDYYAQHYTASK